MALTSVSSTRQQIFLQTAVLFFFSTFFLTSRVSCSKHDIHYSTHCASFVPESTPRNIESTTIPFPLNQDGFFTGGDGIHPSSSQYYNPSNDRRSLLFVTHNVYTTNVQDIYKVQASLIVQFFAMSNYVEDVTYSYSYSPEVLEEVSASGPWRFTFEGFWSKSSGKLCMVGSSKFKLPNGNVRLLAAVLKLDDIRTSNTITNLVRGTMHSLSSVGDMQYFEPMNLLMFPKMNYKYSEGFKESGHICSGGIDVSKSESLGLPLSIPICSIFSSQEINSFELEYLDGCSSTSNCSPLGDGVGFLPRLMSLSLVQCSNDRRSMRFLLQFPNRKYVSYNEPLVPSTTLVSEGSWDADRNHLCVFACRIFDAHKSLSTSHIDDCSIRMSLRFPAFWSIGNTNSIIGNIWSVKPSNVSGYFSMISFKIQYHEVRQIPGLRYNYTLVDKARILCPKKFPSPNRNQYPDENSNEWRFDMSFPNSSNVNTGWGNSEPIFIGDQPKSSNMNPFLGSGDATTHVEESDKKQLKMSHRMMFPFYDASVGDHSTVGFVAEGIYDTETGELCMIGCRFLDNNQKSADNSMECENLVKLKFPPLNSRDHILGRLECKREASDPLYYEPVIFSAVSPYRRFGRQSIKRMDSEVIMSLISSTLVCTFVAYQIFYLKKNPGVISLISLLMLVILTFGQMIPMVTNFDALLSAGKYENFPRRTAGRLEVNEVLLKFLTLLAFLFQFRLLQIIWSERSPDGNGKVAFWTAEKKAFCVSMLLYVSGGLTALSAHWKNNKFSDDKKNYGHGRNDSQHSLWEDLQSYYGLVMDGFLLPQILLNIFSNSREVALSRSFYLGITLVQMLPHAYDLYRVHYFSKDFDWSYKYANPTTDYYSSDWDVYIVVGSLLFAAILHLQQQFGGRFFLPRRFREPEGYDKLPLQSEA